MPEIDTLIELLTRLVIAAEGKPRKNAKLLISDAPIAKPVKAKKAS